MRMSPPPVRDRARALVGRTLWFTERIAVLGATGWFGSTMLALLSDLPVTVLPVASRGRAHTVAGRTWSVVGYDLDRIVEFAPTTVLDFAYLNRGHEATLGEVEYRRRLADLTDRFAQVAELPSVRAVLATSSGAAVAAPEGPDAPIGPYGEGKRAVEDLAAGLVNPARAVVTARAYAVSGPLVPTPGDYAFSDLVRASRTGRIQVRAASQVWRRYCGLDDYLAVCLAEVMAGRSGVIESGGPSVELRDLAALVADRFPGPRPQVVATEPAGPALRYESDDTSWQEACARQGFAPADLVEQIDAVQAGLPD